MDEYIETTARWGKDFVEIIDPRNKEETEILRIYYWKMEELAQPKEWIGLTDDEYSLIGEEFTGADGLDEVDFARAIEAKLKELNT